MGLRMGIDAGTTAVKCALFDADGNNVASATVASSVATPADGHVEQDMDAVWTSVCSAIRRVLEDQDPAHVGSVGIAAQGDGYWAVDANARPTGPAILWNDTRASGIVNGLMRNGGAATIAGDGSITQGGQVIAALGLFAYDPGENPERTGTSAIRVRGALSPIVDDRDVGVMQGFVERSNVDPVREMTRLIRIHRDFDNVAAAIRDAEGATETMIRTLGGSR